MNPRSCLTSLALAASCTASAHAQSPQIPGWRLVWSEEFQGAALDASRWNAENTAWPYNAELEYYLPQQAVVQGGLLNIIADRRSFGGRSYVSARINTLNHFSQQYGRFEARMLLPAGQGYWPAFWLLPASQAWPPELDIMELIGSQPSTVYLTQHWGTVSNVMSNGTTYTGPNYTAGYHNFAIEWSPARIDWLVDGVVRFTTVGNIPQEPMYVVLNLAVGGNLPGNPTAATVFPRSMLVDWVRVYTRDTAPANPGFETAGVGSAPAGWQVFGNAQRTTTAPRSGSAAVQVTGAAGSTPFYSGVYQDLPASPGQVWSASVFARHAAATRLVPGNQVYLKIEWNNASGQQISFSQAQVLSDASPTDTYLPGSLQATAPAGAAAARITLILVQTGSAFGTATLDDVSFTYITPSAITPCVSDFNGVGGPTVQDIFDFLAAWFAANPRADFNQQGGITVQDIFDFLSFWFQGCP